MKDIVAFLKNKEGIAYTGEINDNLINEAENKLNLKFADDYREYISAFGVASFDSHELTGICLSKRLNVIDVTKEERNELIPKEFYVIERLNIDGIIIWQSNSGLIYESQKGSSPQLIAETLIEYLSE